MEREEMIFQLRERDLGRVAARIEADAAEIARLRARVEKLEVALRLAQSAHQMLIPLLRHGSVQDYELVLTKAPLAMHAALDGKEAT